MKIVYIFLSPGPGVYHLMKKILPQLEAGKHGTEVVGMCFFDDNKIMLNQKYFFGLRLTKLAKEKNIVLMIADKADLTISKVGLDYGDSDSRSKFRWKPTECSVITVADGEQVGCFPDLYTALAGNLPDHIISL